MQLTRLRPSASAARPVARSSRSAAIPRRMVLVRSSGPHPSLKDIEEVEKKVEAAIKEAEVTCKESDTAHCAAAWDNVEELSAAAAHKKVAYNSDPVSTDPLEAFCDDNPEADECRVYED